MPSRSKAQQRMMFAAAKDPAVARRLGVPQKVAEEFTEADQALGKRKLPERIKKRYKKT